MASSSFPKHFLGAFLAASSFLGQAISTQNFKATFGSSPAPFEIDVDADFIAETVLKASLTRYVVDLDQPDWVDGPPSHNVSNIRDYWVNEYDWFDIQSKINQQ